MRTTFRHPLEVRVLLALTGCSSSTPDAPRQEAPSRTANGWFRSTTANMAKINLMGVCSSNGMQVQSVQNEIVCISHPLNADREKMIVSLINDEWASRYKDAINFVLTTEGGDVRVRANPIAQFMIPTGVLSGSQATSRNLLDDASFANAQQLLKAAGAID